MNRAAPVLLSALVWIGATAYALIRGGKAERILACALLLELAAALSLRGLQNPYALNVVLFGGDVMVLGACVAVTVLSRAGWSAVATAFQALAVASHVAKLFDPTILSWAYLTLQGVFSYGVLACLAWGTAERRPL